LPAQKNCVTIIAMTAKTMFTKKQQSAFAAIARKFSLNLIILFGSQAKGKTSLVSDVDVAVLPRNGLDFSSFSLIAHQLGKIIGNYNIDLASVKHASPLFLGQIAKNCQPLYEEKKGDFLSFCLMAMKRYADAQPIFKCQEKHLKQKIKKYKRELSE